MRVSIKYPILNRCATKTYTGKERGATYAIAVTRNGYPDLVVSATEYRSRAMRTLYIVLRAHNSHAGVDIVAGGSSGGITDNQLSAALSCAMHSGCITSDLAVFGRGDDVMFEVLEAIAKACGHPAGYKVIF